MLDPVPPFDHAYVPPAGVPVAAIVAGEPAHTVWFVLVNVGIAFTVTVDVDAVDVHPFAV
jgi:hypothetical protein